MPSLRRGLMLRVYVDEQQKHEGRPLYEALIEAAHNAGLASAVVLRGVLGYTHRGENVHSAKILRLSEHLPLVVEIADETMRIDAFLAEEANLLTQGTVVRHVIKIAVPAAKEE
jgi:PII-like signaling protein